jgi:hypothetical protein
MAVLQGPAERYAVIAVWSRYTGTRYRIADRLTGEYLPTVPREYWSRENAAYTARTLRTDLSPITPIVGVPA